MNLRIKKIIREKVKSILHFTDYKEAIEEFLKKRRIYNENIPKVVLQEKHIKNLEVIVDRFVLLDKMSKSAVVAEIGVNKGEFSEQVLARCTPVKLHLIDMWGDVERYHDGLKHLVQEKFTKEIKKGIVEINVGMSTEVIKTFPNEYFDWVYLDTDHSYEVTSGELQLLKDKVKIGGVIAGHDYILGNWAGDVRYGVIEAVHELCVNDNWEIVYLTINQPEVPSFAIRKLINQTNY